MLDRLTRNPTLVRWLPVAVIVPILVADGFLSDHGPPVDVTGVLAAVVACLPLVVRDRLAVWPLLTLVTGGVVLVLWRMEPGTTVVIVPAFALFELAKRLDTRSTLLAAASVVPAVVVSVLPFADDGAEFVSIVVRNVALCELAIAVGLLLRRSRESADRDVAAAEAQAQARLAEERLRIAREVHDVVAHSIVAINVQAGVAAHLLEDDTAQAREALVQIKRTSGEALTDLRATLGVLRDVDGPVPVGPATGLRDLDGLAARLRAAGVEVSVEVGALGDVPAQVHAAGYRIVQEALTNVLRHAHAGAARVTVRGEDGALRIDVTDDGRGAAADGASDGSGSGTRGMRERVEALGGTLRSGPAEAGGWNVRAILPLAGAARSTDRPAGAGA